MPDVGMQGWGGLGNTPPAATFTIFPAPATTAQPGTGGQAGHRLGLSSSLRLAPQRGRSVRKHVDERGGEQSSPLRLSLKDSLHPIVILGLLSNYDYDIPFLETKFIIIVRITVVQGSASLVAMIFWPLKSTK